MRACACACVCVSVFVWVHACVCMCMCVSECVCSITWCASVCVCVWESLFVKWVRWACALLWNHDRGAPKWPRYAPSGDQCPPSGEGYAGSRCFSVKALALVEEVQRLSASEHDGKDVDRTLSRWFFWTEAVAIKIGEANRPVDSGVRHEGAAQIYFLHQASRSLHHSPHHPIILWGVGGIIFTPAPWSLSRNCGSWFLLQLGATFAPRLHVHSISSASEVVRT